jgi:hypothetical protein
MIRSIDSGNYRLDKSGHRVSTHKSIEDYVKKNFNPEKDSIVPFSEINLHCQGCPQRITELENSIIVKMWSNQYSAYYYRLITEKTPEQYDLYKQRITLEYERNSRVYNDDDDDDYDSAPYDEDED